MQLVNKLFLSAFTLNIIGLALIYSATVDPYSDQAVSNFVSRQTVFSMVGAITFMVLATRSFTLTAWKSFLIGGLIVSLFGVILANFSEPIKGSSRWIEVGFLRVQPSEFLKVFTIGSLAFLISAAWEPGLKLAMIAVISLSCFLVVVIQPDLGTASMFLIYGWVAGFLITKPRIFILVTCIFVFVGAPLVWSFVLKPYQKNRVIALIQGEDPMGSNWQSTQSMIAVGSGGLFGKGFLEGTQTRMELIPERHTDFIFAVLAEEFGFVGSAIVVFLTLYVILKLMFTEGQKPVVYVFSILAGVKLGVEAGINLLMVGGLFPVVGVAYPFLSYGGSSLISNYLLLGIFAGFLNSSTKTSNPG